MSPLSQANTKINGITKIPNNEITHTINLEKKKEISLSFILSDNTKFPNPKILINKKIYIKITTIDSI